MQINLGVLFSLLMLASCLVGLGAVLCPDPKKTQGGKTCVRIVNWVSSLLCLASLAVLLIAPFRTSVRV